MYSQCGVSKRNLIVKNNQTAMGKDELSQVLERIIGWTKNCDAKVSIALSGLGVLFGVFLATDHLTKFVAIVKWMICNFSLLAFFYLTFAFISVLLVLIGVYFLFMVLVPRTNILKILQYTEKSTSKKPFSQFRRYSKHLFSQCLAVRLSSPFDDSKSAPQKNTPVSLLFFGTISNFSSVDEYKTKIEECDEKQYIEDLIGQIYICSLVCRKKFDHYENGLIISTAGVVLYCLLSIIAGCVGLNSG